ncbi:hypothetical protein HAX54_050267 [Datura stramonium]|uniref:Uncharacterized protein n=1 Tax=Datura stramonium TaxID=4076 RepID=A0ABS8WNI6_DATST|nr:hypothetical protein [Datura stramonium]
MYLHQLHLELPFLLCSPNGTKAYVVTLYNLDGSGCKHDNTKLTFLIDPILKIIKRDIDKALANGSCYNSKSRAKGLHSLGYWCRRSYCCTTSRHGQAWILGVGPSSCVLDIADVSTTTIVPTTTTQSEEVGQAQEDKRT